MNLKIRFLFIVFLLLPSFVNAGQYTTFNKPPVYYDRNKEGWFWYIEPPAEPKEEPKKEEEKIVEPAPVPAKVFAQVPLNDLRKLSAAELRVHIDDARDEALSKLDFTTTQYYMTVQKEVFDRASLFGVLWKQVLWSTPELDNTVKNPVSTLGNRITSGIESADTDNTIAEAANSTGIFFFFSSTCAYCLDQSRLLKMFSDKYNFRVMAVTLDGICPLEFPGCDTDNGMAVKLEVTKTPTLYIAVPPNGLQLMSSGFLSLPEITKRVEFFWKAYKADRMGPGLKPNTVSNLERR